MSWHLCPLVEPLLSAPPMAKADCMEPACFQVFSPLDVPLSQVMSRKVEKGQGWFQTVSVIQQESWLKSFCSARRMEGGLHELQPTAADRIEDDHVCRTQHWCSFIGLQAEASSYQEM